MKRIVLLISFAAMLTAVCLSVSSDVEYIGSDEDTKGDWPGAYGENGVILFAPVDLPDLKDITDWDDGGNQRWDWANPTQDERGLIYPDDDSQRAGSCMFNNPVGVVTIETDMKNYQVAVYCCDWDSSVRVEDLVGFQGDDPPGDPDVTVDNPVFNAGVYHLWEVTGSDPFKLQITHKDGANWVIGGIFVDDLGAQVDANGKLTSTWGRIKLSK